MIDILGLPFQLNSYSAVALGVIIVGLLFLSAILKHIKDRPQLPYFAAVVAFTLVWQLVEFIVAGFDISGRTAVVLWRISDLATALVLFFSWIFLLKVFARDYKGKAVRLIGAVTLLAALPVLFSPDYYTGVREHSFTGLMGIKGPLAAFHTAYLFLLMGLVLFELLWRHQGADERQKRIRLVILGGASITIFLSIVTEIIFSWIKLDFFPLGGAGMAVIIGAIYFSIYKFSFLNIHLPRFSIGQKIISSLLVISVLYVASVGYLSFVYSTGELKKDIAKMTGAVEGISLQTATESTNYITRSIFENIANAKAGNIKAYLSERAQDLRALAGFVGNHYNEYQHVGEIFAIFYHQHQDEYWYNINTDLEPVEERELLPVYQELSYISTSGQEFVRLADGELRSDLRDVSDPRRTEYKNEDYFQQVSLIGRDEIYLSPVNTWYISEEEARIHVPKEEKDNPAWNIVPGRDIIKAGDMKIGIPVFNGGERRGMIIASLDYRHIQSLTKHTDPGSDQLAVSTPYEGNYILMFDRDGHTIVHPKPNNIRGYLPDGSLMHTNTAATPGGIFNLRDYDQNTSYQQIYQNVINEKKTVVSQAVDVGGRKKMTVSVPIELDFGQYADGGPAFGGLMFSVNAERYYEFAAAGQEKISRVFKEAARNIDTISLRAFANILFLTIATVSVLMAVIIFIIHMNVLIPVGKLKKAAGKIGQGELDFKIDIDSGDELGELASAFIRMAAKITESRRRVEDYSRDLEAKVGEKTAELKKMLAKSEVDKEEMKKQRLAIMNMLEDVSDSQKKLEETYKELEKSNRQLSALKALSDEIASIFEVEEVIMIINKYILEFIDLSAIDYLILSPLQQDGLIYKTYLNKPVSSAYAKKTHNKLLKRLSAYKQDNVATAVRVLEKVRPEYLGARLEDNNKDAPKELGLFPLSIGQRIIGFIQISSARKRKMTARETGLMNAMVNTISLSIDRLQTLIIIQQSKTSSLVNSLNDGVLMFDKDRKMTLMNPSFSAFTGLSGKNFDISGLYRLSKEFKLDEKIGKALDKGEVSQVNEFKIGRKIFDAYITPVNDDKRIVGGALILHDITYRKEIEEMKTEFVSVASHQLRTPLTAVKLFTEMLVKGQAGKLTKGQKEYLDNIYQSTERMVRLVNDLLNVSRIESGRLQVNPQPVKLKEFIENIIAEAKPLVDLRGQKIELVSDIDKGLSVALDKNLVRQVIHNLIVNAIRYSPKGKGRISIRLDNDKTYFTAAVGDNGIGIPEESRHKIFNKFYRADNAVKTIAEGTGLGLYVSKMIVESSEGRIWFEPNKKQGTVFYVQIPLKGMKKKRRGRGLAIS